MRKRLNGTLCAYVVILLFTSLIFYQSFQLRYLVSKIIPLILCIMVYILTFAGMIVELRAIAKKQRREIVIDEDLGEKVKKPAKSMLECTAVVYILAAMIIIFGFLVASPIFVFGYILYNGGKLKTAVIAAACITIFVHLLFNVLLQADLYHGKLFLFLGW